MALSPKTEFQKNLPQIMDLKRQGYSQVDIWRTLKAEGKFNGSQPVFYYHFQRINPKQVAERERSSSATVTEIISAAPLPNEEISTPIEKTALSPAPTPEHKAAHVDNAETDEEELDLSKPIFALNDLPRFDN